MRLIYILNKHKLKHGVPEMVTPAMRTTAAAMRTTAVLLGFLNL